MNRQNTNTELEINFNLHYTSQCKSGAHSIAHSIKTLTKYFIEKFLKRTTINSQVQGRKIKSEQKRASMKVNSLNG